MSLFVCLTCLFVQALVKPTGQRGTVNGWHKVATYPSYGIGAGGWRQAFVSAGNARAKEGATGFWAWLKAAAKAVESVNLLGPLPAGV